ncbi:hypothetical protein GCM10011505_11440 [Tistrella bauzanensis]|uniref:DUF484 domain-containing protein n=2 Tax=Tistrella bauzanensis TaxID=657419 RepID=A0ABQ1IBB7_9PROT|nr:hypothetical protein GCM10011505_11440 [Tistrella bauzanensis]
MATGAGAETEPSKDDRHPAMTSSSDTAAPATGRPIEDADVLAHLARNPDFFQRHPAALEGLTLPGRRHGDAVVDMQRFQIERLSRTVDDIRSTQKRLIGTVQANADIETRVRASVIALVGAGSLGRLNDLLVQALPQALGIERAFLATEAEPAGLPAGMLALPRGSVDRLVGAGRDLRLRGRIADDDRPPLWTGAETVRSDAIVRLKPRAGMAPMLLVLGDSREATWHDGQASDLLDFLAAVIAQCLARLWPAAG